MEFAVVIPLRLRSCLVVPIVGLTFALPAFCRWRPARGGEVSPAAARPKRAPAAVPVAQPAPAETGAAIATS